MTSLKKDLQAMINDLKSITKNTEKLMKQLERLEKASVVKKRRAKAPTKVKPLKKQLLKKRNMAPQLMLS